ncbi:uncharacterized protein CEXT_174981 [Caerostris extrusa]|uniref:RRM domain-containing protein n=1 Tax=Caerostris extrusa TaxID=172846 RepID=A0AAV4UY01_CAEEX|nr:uncharacterized protein CEXT_174981 [Caerostris extrusa]
MKFQDKQNDYQIPICSNAYGGIDQSDNQNIKSQETLGNPSQKRGDTCYKSINDRFCSYASFSKKNDSFNCSENLRDAVRPNFSEEKPQNFPLGLGKRDLYELFRLQSVKIFMVCNKPRVDRKPTEAVVCFMSEQDATDAILTLDNTIYNGRVILVADGAFLMPLLLLNC